MFNISDYEYELLTEYILNNYGIKLGDGKKSLVVSRLQNILMQKQFSSFSEYYQYILSDKSGDAVSTLIDRITTNHTFFMREPDHFEYFRDVTLPYFADKIKDRDFRLWCAGCSTGEEAYTLEMILNDYFGSNPLWDISILATDISSKVLEIAKKGEYANKELDVLPPKWKSKYLRRVDDNKSVFSDKIRNLVLFRSFNLMNANFPFRKKFHVIFCRNVMIYFDLQTQTELVNKFYDYLIPGGYLFIGHSETISRDEKKFKYIKPAVYRKE